MNRHGPVGDGDVDNAAAFVREDDEREQEPTGRRWDDEEISGRDLLEVIRQERAPGLRRGVFGRAMSFATVA